NGAFPCSRRTINCNRNILFFRHLMLPLSVDFHVLYFNIKESRICTCLVRKECFQYFCKRISIDSFILGKGFKFWEKIKMMIKNLTKYKKNSLDNNKFFQYSFDVIHTYHLKGFL